MEEEVDEEVGEEIDEEVGDEVDEKVHQEVDEDDAKRCFQSRKDGRRDGVTKLDSS